MWRGKRGVNQRGLGAAANYIPLNSVGGFFQTMQDPRRVHRGPIKGDERRPPGTLMPGPVFYLTCLIVGRPLTWPAEPQGDLCCQRGRAAAPDNKEAFSAGPRTLPFIKNLYQQDNPTCVSAEEPRSVLRCLSVWVREIK